MTNHAVDKQFSLLEKDLNFNYSVLPCLHTSAQFSQTLPTFGSHLPGLLPPQGRDL